MQVWEPGKRLKVAWFEQGALAQVRWTDLLRELLS